jgi:predicted aminopeptidase
LNRRVRIVCRIAAAATIVLAFVLLEGCYYMQAIGGQMEVLRKRRPLAEVIDDAATEESLRERLTMVQEARQFAVDELLLPENGSYRSYTDLERDFVVWNVFAAPEFSLEPKQWCYPVAGCVAYRGYFSEDKANKKAGKLKKNGLDVFVGGVAAYSTLGRFDDPILNTMMRWSDVNLIQTLFHELAHQKLYVSGDAAFNESFATAVAEIGIGRWLEIRNAQQELQKTERSGILQEQVRQLVIAAWQVLEEMYSDEHEAGEMRTQKRIVLDALSQDVQLAIDDSGMDVRNWLAPPLNNARLVSLGLYEGNLSSFRTLMKNCDGDLECFYAQASALAELEFDQRQARLLELDSG